MSLLFNMWSMLFLAFFPRSKCLLISWLQSPLAVILEPKKIKSVKFKINPAKSTNIQWRATKGKVLGTQVKNSNIKHVLWLLILTFYSLETNREGERTVSSTQIFKAHIIHQVRNGNSLQDPRMPLSVTMETYPTCPRTGPWQDMVLSCQHRGSGTYLRTVRRGRGNTVFFQSEDVSQERRWYLLGLDPWANIH